VEKEANKVGLKINESRKKYMIAPGMMKRFATLDRAFGYQKICVSRIPGGTDQ
jgi:hypothetical protein